MSWRCVAKRLIVCTIRIDFHTSNGCRHNFHNILNVYIFYYVLYSFIEICHIHAYRLRKNLKSLIIVHPSWFIRTLLTITKPFIRSVLILCMSVYQIT